MSLNENSAFRSSLGFAQSKAENLLGDLPALLEQLGAHSLLEAQQICPAYGQTGDLESLQNFLDGYLTDILFPLEFSAITEAFARVGAGETRELIALDQKIFTEVRLAPFAPASRRIGEIQLQRLEPLRGERTVRRYLAAVQAGQAHGWHTVVYGLTLAVYSLPLRQGLLHYGRETLYGFARAATGPKKFLKPACQEMLEPLVAGLPEAIEKTLASQQTLT